MITRLIIAGGRDFTDSAVMARVIFKLTNAGYIADNAELICGMAKGADITAYNLYGAKPENMFKPAWNDLTVTPCVVKTNQYGKYNALAGMNRNHAMGDNSGGLVAFWDSRSTGTKDMIDYMTKLGKPVYVYDYSGIHINTQTNLNLDT